MSLYDQVVAQDAAARAQQIANAAQLTSCTYVQRTRGVGWRQVAVLFDVMFSTEPTFSYGAALVSVAAAGWLPSGAGIVVRWAQDKHGRYNGAVVVVSVATTAAADFHYDGKVPAGTQDHAAPVVAHHLTFNGMGLPRTSADTTLAMQTLKVASSGIN